VSENSKNERILAEVEKRKRQAQSAEAVEEKTEMVIFTLGDDVYAFYGHHVKEILPYEKITLVPGCPDSIIGIINVRGDIESVINLHKLIGIPESRISRKTRIIIAAEQEIKRFVPGYWQIRWKMFCLCRSVLSVSRFRHWINR